MHDRRYSDGAGVRYSNKPEQKNCPTCTKVLNPQLDSLFGDNEAIREATVSSIAGKIAFVPNAGKYVTHIGSGFGAMKRIGQLHFDHQRRVIKAGYNQARVASKRRLLGRL